MAEGTWFQERRAPESADDDEAARRRVRDMLLAASGDEDRDEIRRLEAELAVFERAHGMTSHAMAAAVREGALTATAERCRWLTRWRLLQHLRRAATA